MSSQAVNADCIQQFLREVDQYLTFWNLHQFALANIKPRQEPWNGGTLTIKPSDADVAKVGESHGECMDWGVKLEKTGRELAKSLTLAGYDEAAKSVLTIIHRARGGGGGAERIFPIWEATKTELERLSILLEAAVTKPLDRSIGITGPQTQEELLEWLKQQRSELEPIRDQPIGGSGKLDLPVARRRNDPGEPTVSVRLGPPVRGYSCLTELRDHLDRLCPIDLAVEFWRSFPEANLKRVRDLSLAMRWLQEHLQAGSKAPTEAAEQLSPPTPPSLKIDDQLSGAAADAVRRRPTFERNKLWLKWAEEIGLDQDKVYSQVRDRWNALPDSERKHYEPFHKPLPKGTPGWDTVRKGIETAQQDQAAESES